MRSLANMSKRSKRSEQDLLSELFATQCLTGLMEPEDVASLYLFLASDAAKNITGQTINVDGGIVIAP